MNTTPENTNNYDVIISGAGPVGLFLACELALAECSVLIIEKSTAQASILKQFPFGVRGLNSPSIEAFYRRGLLQELSMHKRMKTPHKGQELQPRKQAGHFAGIPFYEDSIDFEKWTNRLPGSPPLSLMSEMEEIEAVLTRRAENSGVTILRGSAVSGFEQNAEEIIVKAADRSFKAKWLVGCDGARSVVRKLGGFEFAGTEPEFTGYSAWVDIVNPEVLKPGRNITARGMYLQSQPGYLNIQDFDKGAFHDAGQTITPEYLQELLRRISDTNVTLSALHIATTWTDRSRQATSYRNGRILLAGDAAHIHSPLGGQGLNLGLGDAMNLGWKLAATIKQQAPDGLLESYQTERHPVGADVLDWSRAQVSIMKTDAGSRALYTVMKDLLDTHDGASYIAAKVWGIFTHYDLEGEHPLVGYSVPDFEFEDGGFVGELMRDGKGLLIDFSGDASLKKLANELGDQIIYIASHAKDQLGLSVVLVRPDGIVGWANNDGNNSGCSKAAARWFKK